MTTIKSYTNIFQSKKLADILPLESADMRYGYIALYDYSDRMYDGGYDEIPYPKDFLIKNPNFSANEYDAELPCWSLAALLGVLPKQIHDNGLWWLQIDYIHNSVSYMGKDKSVFHYVLMDSDNSLVDACVAMVERLHKLKML